MLSKGRDREGTDMSSTLLRHFANGTQKTQTGARIGMEIETIYVFADTGAPISQAISNRMRAETAGLPAHCRNNGIDLSRATHELVVGPCPTIEEVLERAAAGLAWQYGVAKRFGAVPVFAPEVQHDGPLVDAGTNPRDSLWLQLDGLAALEQLTCASVQFTVDVHPQDAIGVINELWKREVHLYDFAPNDRRWRNYVALSAAGYDPLRYGGPHHFEDGFAGLHDYVEQLTLHDVVMHHGALARLDAASVSDLDCELYLRSVWWHYRLRRPGPLAVEIRPFARRADTCFEQYWRLIAPVLGL